MKINEILLLTIAVAIVAHGAGVKGKRIKLRPMSATEVYHALREAGREDAVPEGRVITQGLAAIKGFAIGITKGIGGTLLLDLATSNATQQMLANFNVSALTNMFSFGGGGSNQNNTVEYQTQEICFSTRSADEISEEETAADEQVRQMTTDPTVDMGTTGATGDTSVITTDPVTTATSTGTSEPVATTGTQGSLTDTGAGTGTATSSTTQTDNPGAVNCIVIQKPVVNGQARQVHERSRGRRYRRQMRN